jgi:CRISPR-associated endonuclease/helicase Cas3
VDWDEEEMSNLPDYFRYWGKAEKDGNRYHLLPYHCLDVAAVAAAWWKSSRSIRRSFYSVSDLSEEQIKSWMLFFTALHDYGKFDVRFQLRVDSIWKNLYLGAGSYGNKPSVYDCKHFYHGEGGLFWITQDYGNVFGIEPQGSGSSFDFLDDPVESISDKWKLSKVWLEAVTGHHGHIRRTEYVADASLSPTCDPRFAFVDQQARKEWVTALSQVFLKPVGLSLDDTPPQCSSLMAGFCSVADWLGSRCDNQNFSFQAHPKDLSQYFEEKFAGDARRILAFAGIISSPHKYAGVGVLLDSDKLPRSVQTMVDDLPLNAGLTIMEAPTGSGKTEAALSYAWRLVEAGLADSIVFALPTQATANAMLGRVERMASKLFEDHPNVLLAHGSARFNEAFAALKHATIAGYEKEDGWVQCSEWLAESRKRVFLGQIGICTIDQVLISVLPVRHRFVRGFGLGRSILIVDEVHAYDAYMYGLLEEVLRQQKVSGGSAILLSATLPEYMRRQLCVAWSATLDEQGENAPYPLIIWTAGDTVVPFKLDFDQLPVETAVRMESLRVSDMKPDDSLLRRAIAAAEAGAQVAIVCNLVNVAQALARDLREKTSVLVDLFHARYCYVHRREKELAAIDCFGPDGERARGRILVATQVVEQSLDVDFDWLITQLCPVDLLFQRMGRLHRHTRPYRPPGFESPICTVLLPEGNDFGLHGVIYANTRVLWRTASKLLSEPEINVVFPDAYRTWIESIYGGQEDGWENEPEAVTQGYEKFKYEIEAIQRYKAQYMVETAINPFSDTDENVTAVTRDGEMNVTVVPICKTRKGTVLMDGSVLEQQGDYKRLECLSLNSVGVPKSWGYYFEKDDEGRCWLEMEPEGEGFRGNSKGVTFRYQKDIGLEREQ